MLQDLYLTGWAFLDVIGVDPFTVAEEICVFNVGDWSFVSRMPQETFVNTQLVSATTLNLWTATICLRILALPKKKQKVQSTAGNNRRFSENDEATMGASISTSVASKESSNGVCEIEYAFYTRNVDGRN